MEKGCYVSSGSRVDRVEAGGRGDVNEGNERQLTSLEKIKGSTKSKQKNADREEEKTIRSGSYSRGDAHRHRSPVRNKDNVELVAGGHHHLAVNAKHTNPRWAQEWCLCEALVSHYMV
jgi:hypothetical protein